jgi:hypothetical protein
MLSRGAVGTRSAMACTDQLRVRVVKDGDVAVAADMVEGGRRGVDVCIAGAM